MSQANYRLLQVTDCHLMRHPDDLYRNQPVYDNLQKVLCAAADFSPDSLLLTGDIAQQESESAYQQLLQLTTDWCSPIYWIPGNHDDSVLMNQLLTTPSFSQAKQFLAGSWQVILLNSKLPYDTGEGLLNDEQLLFLQQQLACHPDKFALVALHHHVLPINGLLDKYPLQNSAEFLALVAQSPQIKVVISGHVHQAFDKVHEGVRFLTAPATSYQITPCTQHFVADSLPPGFRLIDLHSDGSITTEVIRV